MPENRPVDQHLLDMDTLVTNLSVAGVEMQARRLIDSLPGIMERHSNNVECNHGQYKRRHCQEIQAC
ncbi:hypothetical protein LIER_12669 [Lithospermum erythrorhizon]|uniref:Uncharacterized protein n=1 Tax=Lithospermum erythrorhizon TaxID=34254 RepID=A0AAV3PUP2_LITER